MANRNIVFNLTLDQYNRKYRNRTHHLLSYTKKEVEDFDKNYPNSINHRLLKGHKWAFINNTYYEIPRPIRFTWFRNLNAGAQACVCLLGIGGVATAITLPIVLNKHEVKKEVPISIDGADYDKEASHIEINKDSYIVLKEKEDREIRGVKEVKIADKTITKGTDWTYKNKTVVIKAHAMVSLNVKIIVITKDPKPKFSLKLNKSKTFVGANKTTRIVPYVTGGTVDDVKWSSSAEDYATVDKGTVTGLKETDPSNPVIITAKFGNLVATCEVTVQATYEIAWTTAVDFGGSVGTKSPYKLAAGNLFDGCTELVFGTHDEYDSTVSSFQIKDIAIGETPSDLVSAYFNDDGSDKRLYILSDKKICFSTLDGHDDRVITGSDKFGFFYRCRKVKKIDISNIDTSQVNDMNRMFFQCTSIEQFNGLDVLDTSKVTNMESMFNYIFSYKLTKNINIDLSNFDTSKVTNMKNMFYNIAGDLSDFNITLNLSSFDTANVVNMYNIFSLSCNIKTIYVSDKFVVDNIPDTELMFDGTVSIIGGQGTKFNDTYTHKEYARIDRVNEEPSLPGYFTEKE